MAILLGLASWTLLPVLDDPVPGFAERQGMLAQVDETAHYQLTDSSLTEVTLTWTSGLQVQHAQLNAASIELVGVS